MNTGKNSGTSRRKLHNDTSNFEGYALVLATQIYTKILLGLYFRDNGTVIRGSKKSLLNTSAEHPCCRAGVSSGLVEVTLSHATFAYVN